LRGKRVGGDSTMATTKKATPVKKATTTTKKGTKKAKEM
jgi:hypothetical protein